VGTRGWDRNPSPQKTNSIEDSVVMKKMDTQFLMPAKE
jgi:hypothetical protein